MFSYEDILTPLALTVIIDNKVRDPEMSSFCVQAAGLIELFELDPMTEDALLDWYTRHEDGLRAALTGKRKNTMILRALTRFKDCLLYTSPSPRDGLLSRMPSSA